MEDVLTFREDEYEDDDELILAMNELNLEFKYSTTRNLVRPTATLFLASSKGRGVSQGILISLAPTRR